MRKSLFRHNRFVSVFYAVQMLILLPFFAVSNRTLAAVADFPTVSISFRPEGSTPPAGYISDNGLPFADVRKYGWVHPTTKAPISLAANMRLRTGTGDVRQLSHVEMQNNTNGQVPGSWEYALPNGLYNVTVSAGDYQYYNSTHQLNVEGSPAISNFVATAQNKFRVATITVQVNDGKLTVDANGGVHTKMNYIIISSAVTDTTAPTVSARLEGTQQSAGVYLDLVKIYITAGDEGGSGLKTVQYSINDGTYINYTAPFDINTAGIYSLKVKATDGSNNGTISSAYNFSVVISPSTGGAYMVLKNLDNFPADDRLVFSLIQIPWRRTNPAVTPYNANHDRVKLRINSKGSGRLTINNLVLSNTSAWKIVSINTDSTLALPVQINSGAYADITIQFKARDAATRVKVFHDTLTIRSNDPGFPAKKVVLNGLYQYSGEGSHEPYGQEVIDAFGFKSSTGFKKDDGTIDGTTIVPGSSEVNASYFVRADNAKPVTVYQMAAYHGCCSSTETFRYFAKGSSTLKTVFTHLALDGQSLLPRINNSTGALAQGAFSPTGSFGFRAASISSDTTQNSGGLIGFRFLKVYDSNGNIVPNAYLVDMDYIGNPAVTNYDYQDNLYYVDNIKPETGTVNYSLLASVNSSDVSFTPALVGGNVSANVMLKNQGTTYPNGTFDPAIELKSVAITGPDASEFSVSALSTTSLAIQATTSLTVNFKPGSAGIKNAVLVISYNNSQSPLKIPLYGIANNSTTTISIFKRIKGGADVNVTIGGNVYEADKNYRKGSVKLDTQVGASGIGGTDIDALYQTYLSAAAELGETRYEIPLANGNYRVRMHFVENFFTAPGMRVFSAAVENQQVFSNLDIIKEAGYRFAYVKDASATISDGILNIRFNPSTNRLALAGVEIFKVTNNNVRTGGEEDSLAVEIKTVLVPEIVKEDIIVYPNPGQGKNVNLEVNNLGKNEEATVSVIPVSTVGGIRHIQKVFTDQAGSIKIPLNPSNNLQTGIYIISVQSGSKTIRKKLLIE